LDAKFDMLRKRNLVVVLNDLISKLRVMQSALLDRQMTTMESLEYVTEGVCHPSTSDPLLTASYYYASDYMASTEKAYQD